MDKSKEYYAFISYKREDEKWAKWLQNKLEHYRFPTNLNGRTDLPKNIRPTFRDVTDMTPGLLAEKIDTALRDSEWLIIICSPRSAKSPWVCKEAQTFIDLGRTDHIIPFVIEGSPFSNDATTECYPEALLNLTGNKELLAANINEMGREAAAIKVVARMFNIRFDALWQRYEREQKKRKWIGIVGFLLFGIVCLGIASVIEQKNIELEKQHDLLLKSKLDQDISLSKAYLAQQRQEMSLIIMNELESNIEKLDSTKLFEYQQLKESLCDSIQKSPVLLVDIQAARPRQELNHIPESSGVLEIILQSDDEFNDERVCIYNKKTNTTDTIHGYPNIKFRTNQNKSYIAFYVERGYETTDMDTVYSQKKSGIRIYSLKTGNIKHFICCWGWYSWMAYPMGLSNDGNYLIYREGSNGHECIWFMDYTTGERTIMYNWYTNTSEQMTSSFSPDNRFFYISNTKNNEIIIYSSQSRKKLHTFRYESCDDVFWDESNNICISSNGNTFVWRLSENKYNQQFHINTYAKGVAISDNKQYAATACDNGKIYIWNILRGEVLYEKEIMIAPMDVAFSKDNKSLWVISGYNCISTIDIESKKTNVIYEDSATIPHPWRAYLYMTKNGKYCISICNYDEKYLLFDMKGTLLDSNRDKNENILFSEFEYPENFSFGPNESDIITPQITAKRISSDGKVCIEGYSNGVIKIVSLKEREIIESLIGKNKVLK